VKKGYIRDELKDDGTSDLDYSQKRNAIRQQALDQILEI
jgi:hypothetical protein